MQPERPLDEEPVTPAGVDGIARMYSLAFVCVLSLIAGGAAAVALYHARQGAVEVRGVAGERHTVGRDPGAEPAAVEDSAAEDTRTEGEETLAADEVGDGTVASAGKAGRYEARVRVRAESGERAGDARATRRYARAPGRQLAAGARGLGGHALGGVKKTGEGVKKTGAVLGKTLGKVGGVFHD